MTNAKDEGRGELRGWGYHVPLSDAAEAGLIARETEALRRELSMTFQDALSYLIRRNPEKWAAARPSSVHLEASPATLPTPALRATASTAPGNE